MFEKCDSLNRQKLMVGLISISARFTVKFELSAFSWRFHFKPNRKSIGSFKKWY